jgi:hypothetical protein
MLLIVERRAEIALRSLQPMERKRVERSLQELLTADRSELRGNPKFHALRSERSGKQLFVYVGTPKLRLIISFPDGDTCLVQDIVDHDRLDRLMRHEGQE